MFGTSSPRIPILLGNDSLPNQLTPVTLLPGRLRLVTRPTLIGSAPLVKTVGISAVAALAANAELLPPTAAITATCRRTSSAAKGPDSVVVDTAAPPVPHFPRFRALALLGRRPPQP